MYFFLHLNSVFDINKAPYNKNWFPRGICPVQTAQVLDVSIFHEFTKLNENTWNIPETFLKFIFHILNL